MPKTLDDGGLMFTDEDVEQVQADIQSLRDLCDSAIHWSVGKSNRITGPCMTITATAPGVGSASIVFGVDMWAKIAEHSSQVIRGVMWCFCVQEQLIATAQHEWISGEEEEDDE